MPADPPSVFLVTLEGVEPPDSTLTVLAFTRADESETAMAVASAELEAMGWRDVRALRTGELIDWDALPEDFRGAVDTAVRFGCGLIIYDDR